MIAATSIESAYISSIIMIELIHMIAFTGSSAHTSASKNAIGTELIFVIYPMLRFIVKNAMIATTNLTTGNIKCSYSP